MMKKKYIPIAQWFDAEFQKKTEQKEQQNKKGDKNEKS